QIKEDEVERAPPGRRGTPEEVAAGIVDLTNPTASWITGPVRAVDGGRSIAQVTRVTNRSTARSGLVQRPESAPCVPRAKNERSIMLRQKIILLVLLSLIAGPLRAQESKLTSLMSQELREFSGKEGLMITVEYAPGGSDSVPHRHDAHSFVYVLEGSVVMQVKGG